ncbi:MAG TPA: hypothetical protein VMU59_04760 [Caulobacteraceae bacterium]|nr:hypothetical protein [Caulobacteraceae bacterium]
MDEPKGAGLIGGGVARVLAVVAVGLCVVSPVRAEPGAEAAPASATGSPIGGPGSLDGLWNNAIYTTVRTGPPNDAPRYTTAEGEPIPMLPWAAKVYAERLSTGKDYPDDSIKWCVHRGMPTAIATSAQSPIQIVETPKLKQITVLYELFSTFRIINMDRPHPAHPVPSFMGDAVGHWEGDTLIVDTIAVSDKTTIMNVIPHTDQMHLVERIRLTGPGAMEDYLTIDDPKTFSKPWTMVAHFKRVPGMRMAEDICQDNTDKF